MKKKGTIQEFIDYQVASKTFKNVGFKLGEVAYMREYFNGMERGAKVEIRTITPRPAHWPALHECDQFAYVVEDCETCKEAEVLPSMLKKEVSCVAGVMTASSNVGSFQSPGAFNANTKASGSAHLKQDDAYSEPEKNLHKNFVPIHESEAGQKYWKRYEKMEKLLKQWLKKPANPGEESLQRAILQVLATHLEGLDENKLHEISYKDFKSDEAFTPRQKVNLALIEISRNLRTINRTFNHATKLKTEMNVGNDQYWKRTYEVMDKITARLVEAVQKFKGLRAQPTNTNG